MLGVQSCGLRALKGQHAQRRGRRETITGGLGGGKYSTLLLIYRADDFLLNQATSGTHSAQYIACVCRP